MLPISGKATAQQNHSSSDVETLIPENAGREDTIERGSSSRQQSFQRKRKCLPTVQNRPIKKHRLTDIENDSPEESLEIKKVKLKDKLRKSIERSNESVEARTYRLHKMNEAEKLRRLMEPQLMRKKRLKKKREMDRRRNAFICSQAVTSSDSKPFNTEPSDHFNELRKDYLWKLINQNIEPQNDTDSVDLKILAESYEKDLKRFRKEIEVSNTSIPCAVCGLTIYEKPNIYKSNDKLFYPLHEKASLQNESWLKYASHSTSEVSVCSKCIKILQKKKSNVPKFSRANIQLPDPVPELKDLSFIEQMLISPVLPMVCLWRYRTFGQYQSKGQCIAFYNQVQEIAKVLPRTLSEVVINIKDTYGHLGIIVRIQRLRNALIFLKSFHPAYKNIEISEANIKEIEKNVTEDSQSKTNSSNTSRNEKKFISGSRRKGAIHLKDVEVPQKNILSEGIEILQDREHETLPIMSTSAADNLKDLGQNQLVEEHVAQSLLTAPLTIEASDSRSQIVKCVTNLFDAVAKKRTKLYSGKSVSSGWELMFPCLMWNGRGAPDDTVYVKVSLRDWINYVIRIQPLQFQNHVIFLSFSNIVLRRQRITGLTAHKPISSSVEDAVKELVQIAQSPRAREIPDCTLTSLAKKIGVFINELPGSLSDMKKFRNDILSMMKKHGPPSYFLTLSSADSMWPEGFVEISNGRLTIEEARELSVKERADMIANNPVKITIAWKKRVQAFLTSSFVGIQSLWEK